MIPRSYGWIPDVPDQRDLVCSLAPFRATIPTTLDLRPICAPIRDQFDLGACTGFAIDGADQLVQRRDRHAAVPTAPLFSYYEARRRRGSTGVDSGASIRDIFKAAAKSGICAENVWPYHVEQFATRPSDAAYRDAATRQLTRYARVPQDERNICFQLAQRNPVVVGISVYASFETADVARTGLIPLPAPREKLLGGHAICLVGYDRQERVYIMRNSWGESWGLAGYAEIPMDYIHDDNLAADLWTLSHVEIPVGETR